MSTVLEQADTPTTQTIVLPVSEALMTGVRPCGAVVEALAWEIDSAEMAQLAADQRTAWARRIDQIEAMQKDFLAPAKEAVEKVKAMCAKWLAPARDDLIGGRDILGEKLLDWDREEKARIERERAEREALARKLRQEAEAKVAAERARAEEQAREARRKAEEAEAARRRAEAEGNARAAAAAAAAAAKAQAQAQAAIESGGARAQEAQMQAAAVVAAAPVAEPVKIAGQAVKDNWVAEIVAGLTEDQAKAMLIAGAQTRPELRGLLKVDAVAVGRMAKALKEAMSVPGYIAVNRPQLAGSRK